jgi:hypothetical protein
MSTFVKSISLIVFIGLFAIQSQARAAGDYDADFRPACASGSHYACWFQPYGTRFCGCWLGGDRPACPVGYFFACGHGPNGGRDCGCY